MLPTTIRTAPVAGDFTPLAEYQSQTPSSFIDGKPILHLHLIGAKASMPRSQSSRLAVFAEESSDAATVEETVEILVTSENFIMFSARTETGVSIPYPTISIHAIKKADEIWMQLDLANGGANDDEEDFESVELTVNVPAGTTSSQLYEAISSCSNLHPDQDAGDDDDDDDDDNDRIVFEGGDTAFQAVEGYSGVLRGAADGGLPPPLPGSGGWFTADNVHEYFDEDGNWIGGQDEELGEGAGRTRPHDEVDVNGHGRDEDTENKRPRVD